MAHLVRDDIGARELARRAETLRKVLEERSVEIDTAVGRAIEGPHGGAGQPTGGVDRAPEEHELRGTILTSHPLEDRAPRVLRVAENPRDEFLRLVARPWRGGRWRRGALGGRRRRVFALKRHEDVQRVEAKKPADRQNHDQSDAAQLDASPEASCGPGGLAVLDIAASPHVSPAHGEPSLASAHARSEPGVVELTQRCGPE